MKKEKDQFIKSRCEQHIIRDISICKILDNLSFFTKNVYNAANYIKRQEFINNGKQIKYEELTKIMSKQDCVKELGSACSQQIQKKLEANWQSFFASIKDWKIHPEKYKARPHMPKYLPKDGHTIIVLTNQQCKIEDGIFKITFKPLKDFAVKTNIKDKLVQCQFTPKGKNYSLEIIYETRVSNTKEDNQCYVAVDLGVDNFITVVNNKGLNPFIINGKPLKSINQFYNKEKSQLQSDLMLKHQKHWSNRMQSLTDKRNNKIKDYIHKASRKLIDYCQENNINSIVIGLNKGWKQETNIGKINNQKFVSIPYDIFIKQVQYKAENVGINVIVNNESYTSGTSFLDEEEPIKENYDKSRRVHRGLFKSNKGVLINADVNGAYQILKKAIPNSFDKGIEGVGLHPVRVNL